MVPAVRSLLGLPVVLALLVVLGTPAQAAKTTVCHHPTTGNPKVLNVGNAAGHLRHGDFVVGEQCFEGVGACEAGGVTQCVAGDFCTAAQGAPSAEVCNGLDDDCNGIVDNDPTDLGSCTGGVGECVRDSSEFCLFGRKWCDLVPMRPPENPEVSCADGRDNDCDGLIDNADEADCLDRDGDGVVNSADNCPTVPNPTQDAAACDCPCFTHTDIDTDPPRPPPASTRAPPCAEDPLNANLVHEADVSDDTRGYAFQAVFFTIPFFCSYQEEPSPSAGFLEFRSILQYTPGCRALIVHSDLWQQCP